MPFSLLTRPHNLSWSLSPVSDTVYCIWYGSISIQYLISVSDTVYNLPYQILFTIVSKMCTRFSGSLCWRLILFKDRFVPAYADRRSINYKRGENVVCVNCDISNRRFGLLRASFWCTLNNMQPFGETYVTLIKKLKFSHKAHMKPELNSAQSIVLNR